MHISLALVLAALPLAAQSWVIRNATVYDGLDRPPMRASVRVADGVVAEIGTLTPRPGETVIDARGLALAPGFIDIHNHSDRGLNEEPDAESQVAQGITTLVLGADGGSPWPIAPAIAARRAKPVAVNTMYFAGHANLRRAALGKTLDRTATPGEITAMKKLLAQAMSEGAVGLSTGLEYDPALHSSTGEVIELARVASAQGGIYMSHIRDEGNRFFESLDEAIRIGREAKIPVQISHMKLATASVWGQSQKAIDAVNAARAEGVDVTADVYPYEAWSSTIAVLVPSRRHSDPEEVRRGLADVGGADRVLITSCSKHPDYTGKTLAAVASGSGRTPEEVYQEIVRDGGASVVCRSMVEPDIRRLLSAPWAMVASDGGVSLSHPRSAGTFPRILARFVREQKVLRLEQAVHKMSAMPAQRLGLTNRGQIRKGFQADLVLFDPATVLDQATFEDPFRAPQGIAKVWVNGVLVMENGKPSGNLPGLPIARPPAKPAM